MQTTEQGHFKLIINNKTFNLVASFRNMAKIASASRLLTIFELIHGKVAPINVKTNTARDILIACSDNDDISDFLVSYWKGKPRLKKHQVSISDQIIVAAALMRHGIAGVNAPKYSGSGKKGEPIKEFDVYKYVSDAKQHFGMSLDEAWGMTMTEFRYHLASKFPPESDGKEVPTVEEHTKSMQRPETQELYRKALEALGDEE